MSFYFWIGREAEDIEPYCDGDLPDMECIESDGFVTCYFSGPIRPLPDYDNGEFFVSWGGGLLRVNN